MHSKPSAASGDTRDRQLLLCRLCEVKQEEQAVGLNEEIVKKTRGKLRDLVYRAREHWTRLLIFFPKKKIKPIENYLRYTMRIERTTKSPKESVLVTARRVSTLVNHCEFKEDSGFSLLKFVLERPKPSTAKSFSDRK